MEILFVNKHWVTNLEFLRLNEKRRFPNIIGFDSLNWQCLKSFRLLDNRLEFSLFDIRMIWVLLNFNNYIFESTDLLECWWRVCCGTGVRSCTHHRIHSVKQFSLDLLANLELLNGSYLLLVRLSFQNHLKSIFYHMFCSSGTENLGNLRPFFPESNSIFDDNIVVFNSPIPLN